MSSADKQANNNDATNDGKKSLPIAAFLVLIIILAAAVFIFIPHTHHDTHHEHHAAHHDDEHDDDDDDHDKHDEHDEHDDDDEHEHDDHDKHHAAHVHGEAQMNIVLEGKKLYIEFNSPAANIVGFEYKPKNAAEKQAVATAIENLENAADAFDFPAAAGVSLSKATAQTAMLKSESDKAHSDFKVKYSFTCQKPAALDSFTVKLFAAYKGLEKIKAQVITPNTQSAKTLTPPQNSISLK